MTDQLAIRLARPVDAHGETVTVLRLREPTANAAWECGLPLTFSAGGEAVINMQVMMRLASRLAAVPLSSVKAMSMPDIMTVVERLTPFFAPPPQSEAAGAATDPSNAPSISHGSGSVIPATFSR